MKMISHQQNVIIRKRIIEERLNQIEDEIEGTLTEAVSMEKIKTEVYSGIMNKVTDFLPNKDSDNSKDAIKNIGIKFLKTIGLYLLNKFMK